MQIVPQSFHDKSQAGIRKHRWSVLLATDKSFDDSRTFFTLDSSLLDGTDILAPVGDNPIQFWDFYKYYPYTDRVISMEWGREIEFPYSVQSSTSNIVLNNIDGKFTSGPIPAPSEVTVNHSTNPSFETGSGAVEVRRNIITNPSFETNTSGWLLNDGGSGTSSVLSRSTSWSKYGAASGLLTQNATTRVPEIRLSGGGGTTFPSGFTAGNTYTVTATTRYTQDIVGNPTRRPRILYGWSQNSGGSYTTLYSNPSPSQAGEYTLSVTFTIPANATGFTLSFCGDMGQAPGYCWWDGILAEKIGASLPYFDGSTNDGFDTASLTPAWTGTANNSASILQGTAPVGFDDSSTGNSVIWLSSDSPNHGSKFVRGLIKNTNAVSFNTRDTIGTVAEELTGSMYVRSSRAVNGTARWITGVGFNANVIGTVSLPSNSWHEIRNTRTVTHNNMGLSLLFSPSPFQAGDIIDIDNHMVVKGNYTGAYFDGNSSTESAPPYRYNYVWDSTANASVSRKERVVDAIRTSPGTPVKLLSGYEGSGLLQQFAGITVDRPEIDHSSGTIKLLSMDYLSEIFKLQLSESVAMSNVRTDEALAALFQQFGIEAYQYELARGRNTIPFLFLQEGLSAADAFRKVMQAEGGQLWIDEQGMIRFDQRLIAVDGPVFTFNESNISAISTTEDTEIINRVNITSNIRAVQDAQPIHAGSGELSRPTLSEPVIIPASSSGEYNIKLADPLGGYSEPTNGFITGDSWFTVQTKGGSSVTSNVTVTDSLLTVNTLTLTFTNTNSFDVYINAIEVYGEPARIVDTLNYEAYDQDSIDEYGEHLLAVENDLFGSESNCESFAYTVIDAYSQFDSIVEMSVKGDPALQLGDIIWVDTRKIAGQFQIIKISNSISASGVRQVIKAKRYNPRHWFILDISMLDGTDVLAP